MPPVSRGMAPCDCSSCYKSRSRSRVAFGTGRKRSNFDISQSMAVTPKRARELALSLENASEAPHFDRLAFRTPRRTFATLARDGSDLNFMFEHAQQAHFCALAPDAFAP